MQEKKPHCRRDGRSDRSGGLAVGAGGGRRLCAAVRTVALLASLLPLLAAGCSAGRKCSDDKDCDTGAYCRILQGICATDCSEDKECREGEACDTIRGKCKEKRTCLPKDHKRCIRSPDLGP